MASLVGARIGSRLIRPVLVAVCRALAVRPLLDPQNPMRRAVASVF